MIAKKILGITMLILTAAPASAQIPNLLKDCVTDTESQMDNRIALFGVWDCFYEDGKPLPAELQSNSVFSKVYASENALYFKYNNSTRNVPGNTSNGFSAGMPVVILDFPTNIYPHNFEDLCFCYPINVQEEGDYNLTGSAICLSANNLAAEPKSFVNTASMLVFVADKEPCRKTMTVEQDGDKNYLAVRNPQGVMMPSAYTPMPPYKPGVNTLPFELKLHLTKDTKYLSIYGPMQQIMFGNLQLVSDKIPAAIKETGITDTAEKSDETVYSLQGTKMKRQDAERIHGIYIISAPSGTSKIRL